MNLDSLYTRKAELQRSREDLSDQITDISNRIELSAGTLQKAKTDYLIDPSSSELIAKQKSSQAGFDSLVDEESVAIRDRNDLDNALSTISTRILTQEAAIALATKTSINAKLPAKLIVLEDYVLRAMANYQAAMSLSGVRSEPQLATIRIVGARRAEYLSHFEEAKAELTEELSR